MLNDAGPRAERVSSFEKCAGKLFCSCSSSDGCDSFPFNGPQYSTYKKDPKKEP